MKLAEARKSMKMSQEKLGVETNMSRGCIAQVEAGIRKPWPSFKRKTAAALGLSEEEIFGDDNA